MDQDANGDGIKPFAINEMSMLAYYHHIKPDVFKLFPVVPVHDYNLNKYVCNMSEFGPGGSDNILYDILCYISYIITYNYIIGSDVGPPTGAGVWDPNSWGQLIGGTHYKRGNDRGFTDASHIAGIN